MKATLTHPVEPIDLGRPEPPGHADCFQDLGLDAVVSAASTSVPDAGAVVAWALAHPLTDLDAIHHRQDVLTDFLAHPHLLDDLLAVCTEALDTQRSIRHAFFWRTEHPDASLRRSVNVVQGLLPHLTTMRDLAVRHESTVQSKGLRDLFHQLQRDLDEPRLKALGTDLEALTFDDGVLADVRLGPGASVEGYRLRRPRNRRRAERLSERVDPRRTVKAPPTDDGGVEITALRDHALDTVSADLERAHRHLVGFLEQLRLQLCLVSGGVALDRAMAKHGLPRCLPDPQEPGARESDVRGLRHLGIALQTTQSVVGNDLVADDRRALVVTGANNGGKSTFLRSYGQAQLLMQAGFTVPAERFRLGVVHGVHTHFRRGEDRTMTSGKLVEEMGRMSTLVDRVRPHSLVLFNESFATTYELEGTRIASTVVRALIDCDVAVAYVTHMYELVRWFIDSVPGSRCLVAERADDGRRTFRMVQSEPERTSYALELYDTLVTAPGGTNGGRTIQGMQGGTGEIRETPAGIVPPELMRARQDSNPSPADP